MICTTLINTEWKFLLLHVFTSVWCYLCFSPFNKCAEVPHYFNLQFPNDLMLSILHMLICHLCIIFFKLSVQIFCLLFNWVVFYCWILIALCIFECQCFIRWYRLDVCVPTKFTCWNRKPQCDGIWRWGLQELIRSGTVLHPKWGHSVDKWCAHFMMIWL